MDRRQGDMMEISEIRSLLQVADEMRAAAERGRNEGSRIGPAIVEATAQRLVMKATIETLLLVLDSLEGVVRYSAPTDPTGRQILPPRGADPTLT